MKLVEDVFEIAESFMKDSKYVKLNESRIKEMSDTMLTAGKPTFPIPDVKDPFKGIVLEMVAASVNYCYWYGRPDIRPCGASSTRMYELLMNCFFDFEYTDHFKECLNRFGRALSINRFPLLQERINHLKELEFSAMDMCFNIEYRHSTGNITEFFTDLVEYIPGFGSDIFLKRASLFFIQLFRRFGWFANDLNLLHVPADYQIPKMLEHYNCIQYHKSLKQAILDHQLIPKNSLQECEIRAATIMAIKKMCEITKWNVAEVDGFFFTRRHDCTNPFHLTITTDY